MKILSKIPEQGGDSRVVSIKDATLGVKNQFQTYKNIRNGDYNNRNYHTGSDNELWIPKINDFRGVVNDKGETIYSGLVESKEIGNHPKKIKGLLVQSQIDKELKNRFYSGTSFNHTTKTLLMNNIDSQKIITSNYIIGGVVMIDIKTGDKDVIIPFSDYNGNGLYDFEKMSEENLIVWRNNGDNILFKVYNLNRKDFISEHSLNIQGIEHYSISIYNNTIKILTNKGEIYTLSRSGGTFNVRKEIISNEKFKKYIFNKKFSFCYTFYGIYVFCYSYENSGGDENVDKTIIHLSKIDSQYPYFSTANSLNGFQTSSYEQSIFAFINGNFCKINLFKGIIEIYNKNDDFTRNEYIQYADNGFVIYNSLAKNFVFYNDDIIKEADNNNYKIIKADFYNEKNYVLESLAEHQSRGQGIYRVVADNSIGSDDDYTITIQKKNDNIYRIYSEFELYDINNIIGTIEGWDKGTKHITMKSDNKIIRITIKDGGKMYIEPNDVSTGILYTIDELIYL